MRKNRRSLNIATQGILSRHSLNIATQGFVFDVQIIPIPPLPTPIDGSLSGGGKKDKKDDFSEEEKLYKIIVTTTINGEEVKEEKTVKALKEPKVSDVKINFNPIKKKINLEVKNAKIIN